VELTQQGRLKAQPFAAPGQTPTTLPADPSPDPEPKPAAEPDREAAAPRNLTRERERDLGHYLTSGAGDGDEAGERGSFGCSANPRSASRTLFFLRWLGAFSLWRREQTKGRVSGMRRRRLGLRLMAYMGLRRRRGAARLVLVPVPFLSCMESLLRDTSWRGELGRVSFRCSGGSLTPDPGGLGPLAFPSRQREVSRTFMFFFYFCSYIYIYIYLVFWLQDYKVEAGNT
jgi:hypothetical protein